MSKKTLLNEDALENVSGGSLGWDPDENGKFKVTCGYSKLKFSNISMNDMLRVIEYSASIPDTAEGEAKIIEWAQNEHIF